MDKKTDLFNSMRKNASNKDIEKIDANINNMNKGKLKDVWDKILLMIKLIKDPKAAWSSKAIAIGALIYVVSPIDAIPDAIPVVGLTDDVAVVLSAVSSLAYALKKYEN